MHAGEAFRGLMVDGTLVVVGLAAGTISVRPGDLITGRRRLMGSPTGSRKDLRDALRFAAEHGVRVRTSPHSLEDAPRLWDELHAGTVRGPAVLAMD